MFTPSTIPAATAAAYDRYLAGIARAEALSVRADQARRTAVIQAAMKNGR